MARKGQEVELKAKQLVIDEIELLDFNLPYITVRVVCSKGTYIRALARDIGAALKSGAYLVALRRTRVGNYNVDNCFSVDSLMSYLDWADMVLPDKEAFSPKNKSKEVNGDGAL